MRGKRLFTVVVVMVVVLLAGFPGSVPGAEWIYFAETAEGTHYYDKQTVKRANETIRVWEKTVYSEEGKRHAVKFLTGTGEYKGKTPGHSIMLNEFNCVRAKVRSLSMVIYDVSEKRIAGSAEDGDAWRDIVPKTLHESLFQQVCR